MSDASPMEYTKKPVTIRALKYTDETRQQIIDWSNCCHEAIDDYGSPYELENLRIDTLEGEMILRKGHWLIEGVNGEFYRCAPHIFEKTYASGRTQQPPQIEGLDEAIKKIEDPCADLGSDQGWSYLIKVVKAAKAYAALTNGEQQK